MKEKDQVTVERQYTIAEVSGILQLDPITVTRYIKQGKMNAYRLAFNCYRVPQSSLIAFLEASKQA